MNVLDFISLMWTRHFTYGIYGRVKFMFHTIQIKLGYREPFTELSQIDCMEHFFDI